MLGNVESPVWLSTDTLLVPFAKNRQDAIQCYIDFVKSGVGKTVWDALQHQIFLGGEAFVTRHQAMQDGLEGKVLMSTKSDFFDTCCADVDVIDMKA
jgi:putative transposase